MVRRWRVGVAEIVDAFQHDHVLHARLRQHVAIEARQRVDAEADIRRAVVQDAIAADAGVEHADLRAAAPRLQTVRQNVRPAMIGVHGGAGAVGDRIAERHHRGGRFRRQHIHAGEKHPGGDGRAVRERGAPVRSPGPMYEVCCAE